ncbi:MAG: archease [Thermoguttaceae bacterium]
MYEVFEHTADVGIRIRAESLGELFADAARGLFSLMIENPQDIRPSQEVTFSLTAENTEELLHDWLAELLYTFHAQRIVLTEFQVQVGSATLTATVRGEPIDLERHRIDLEVKAITWCGLKVEQQGGEWLAEVIVDV